MQNYTYLIAIIFSLGPLNIQGMKRTKVKNLKRILLFKKNTFSQGTEFPKNLHPRYFSASSQNVSKVQNIPIQNVPHYGKNFWNKDFTSPKRFFASDSPFMAEEPLQPLNNDDVGKIKTDIDITFKRLELEYKINIPHLQTMIKNNDPALEKYTADFFKEKQALFERDLDEIKRIMKKKLESLDNEELLKHLEDAYRVIKRDIIGFNFGQAEGFIKRYRYDKNNPSFIRRWRDRLIGKKGPEKNNVQKRSYSPQKGFGYYSGILKSPKTSGKRLLHVTAAQEKREIQMQRDQQENYNETISIAVDKNNKNLKNIRTKLKVLVKQYDPINTTNFKGNDKGVYSYMKHFNRYVFSSAPNDQKVKIKMLAARLYLLEEQLPGSVNNISLNTIEYSPFYQYMRNTFFSNIPQERFLQDLETFILPQSADDFMNIIHDMTWNSQYAAYVIPNKNNLVLDLYANTLLAYILYKPKCTTKLFIQFCSFLNKMVTDLNYRRQQLNDLEFKEKVIEKNPKGNISPKKERGLWSNFLSAFGRLFQSSDAHE